MRRNYHIEQGGLPAGFTQMNYLQSSGTQRIDSGYVNNSDISKIEFCVLNPSRGSGNESIFGQSIAGSMYHGTCAGFGSKNTDFLGSLNSQQTWITYKPSAINTPLEVAMTPSAFSVNGQAYTYSGKTTPGNAPLPLFCIVENGSYYNYASIRLYHFNIYEGGVAKRMLVPVRRDYDNKPGLYDLCGSICPLTGTPFYINSGTGEFLIG